MRRLLTGLFRLLGRNSDILLDMNGHDGAWRLLGVPWLLVPC